MKLHPVPRISRHFRGNHREGYFAQTLSPRFGLLGKIMRRYSLGDFK
jgi:hypothetical protein